MGLLAELKAVSQKPVFDYWFKDATNELFTVSLDGQISKNTLGKEETVSTAPIAALRSVQPSPDGFFALIDAGNFTSENFIIFNTASKEFRQLPSGTSAGAWSPDGKTLAFLKEESDGSASLITLNMQDQAATTTLKLFNQDRLMSWPETSRIILTDKPSAKFPGSSWLINLSEKKIVPFIPSTPGLMLGWGLDGATALEFSAPQFSAVRLDLVSATGTVIGPAPFPPTLPSKCLLTSQAIFCGVPKNLSGASVLPDDYLKRAFYSRDNIYIAYPPFATSTAKIIDSKDYLLDLDHPRLNKTKDKLFLINRYDQKLYSVDVIKGK